jgi:hypothetical protein
MTFVAIAGLADLSRHPIRLRNTQELSRIAAKIENHCQTYLHLVNNNNIKFTNDCCGVIILKW